MKKVYKCSVCGDIHVGLLAPEVCPTCHSKSSYKESTEEEALATLQNRGEKKLWRCMICNDMQIGRGWPEICPTCQTVKAYVEIDEQEFKILLTGLIK